MADKYYRLVCLISNICTEPLRALFLKLGRSDPTRNFVDLQNYLGLRQAEIYHLKSRKIVRDDQYDLLYPTNVKPDVANWDVTLLVTVIKNLFKNRLSPVENFTLEEMRDVRNKLQHVADTSQMPDETYDDFWNRLQSASTTLARQVSGSTYETEIDEKIKAVRINNMPDLGDALKKFFEEDRKQMLVDQRQMAEELTATKDTVNKMKDSMEKMEKQMMQKIIDLQTQTNTVVGHSAESSSILRCATVTKVGAMGEAIKRFKSVDQKLLRLRTNFQSTMSQLSGDFLPTYGVSEIKDKLQRHHHVVVSGSQGSRFLETALFAIKNLGYVVERCVEMTESSEWDHIDPEDVDLVVCRNPFGNHVYDKDKAKALYGKFDSILLTVKPRPADKHLDFILITDSESLMEFEATKEHELLEVVVKLFAPTSVSRPEDLTGSCNGYPAKGSMSKGHISREMTAIYLARDFRHVYHSTMPTVKSAKTKLKKNKFLLISGPPNSGKTALAVHLASSYQQGNVLVLSSSSDFEHLDLNTTLIVIIDEFVGKHGFVVTTVRGWFHTFDLLYEVVCAGKLNVIIVCETENLRRCFKEIGPHPMLMEPENLTGSQVLVKQEHVSAIACTYIPETGQSNSSFSSENRARYITSVSQYDVTIADEDNCWIYGCCMLPNDEILLVDSGNRYLKKLDASYLLTSTCRLWGVVGPFDLPTLSTLTYIGNSEVVIHGSKTLVYVNVSGKMSIRKTVELHTYCNDITCCNDRLYVLYPTSIHICTLEGDTVSVLPLEESAGRSRKIAVADDGRMYVIDSWKGQICLDSSGNVLNTLPDVKLRAVRAVCVDDRGNVWSGGYGKVYQTSADGSQILNTLSVNTVDYILSLCYDKHRSSLIIGGISDITVIGLN